MARVVALVVVLLAAAAPAAHAFGDRIDVDDIIPMTDASPQQIRYTADLMGIGTQDWQLGYHYERVAILHTDIWRSSGEFILYDDHVAYVLDDAELQLLGDPPVPLSYRIPPGLLVILGLGELAIMIKTRRKAWITIAIGVGLLALALAFLLLGLGPESTVPALLGVHHIVAAWLAVRNAARLEAEETPPAEPPAPEPARPSRPPLGAPPVIDHDPFRSPPRATIAAVQPQPARAATAPIVHDPNADKPKLLG